MIVPLGLPITDRAVGEERGVAAAASVQQRRLAANVQIGFLLAGEASVGQVFGGGAGANGDVDIISAAAPAELAIGFDDRLRGLVGPIAA